MPFEPHSLFQPPENEDAKIWRYIDFTKFVSLLDTQSLFFVRADKIAQLDPFEGRDTNVDAAIKATIEKREYADLPPDFWKMFGIDSAENLKIVKTVRKKFDPITKQMIMASIFINSWHIGEDESDAMWKLYTTGNNGIALRSTYKKLRDSFQNSSQKVMIGKVKYIDYNKGQISQYDTFSPFLHKKTCYQHESELRAIVWDFDQLEYRYFDADGRPASPSSYKQAYMVPKDPKLTGIPEKSDIELLVEELYISPKAEQWFSDLVESIARKYGYNFAIKQSDIYFIPKFE